MTRIRAFPFGTVGKPIAMAKMPFSNNLALNFRAISASPNMTGVIGVAELPVSKPRFFIPSLKKRPFSQRRSTNSVLSLRIRIASKVAATSAAGKAEENKKGRAFCFKYPLRLSDAEQSYALPDPEDGNYSERKNEISFLHAPQSIT